MQIMITHGSLARTRVLNFSRWQLLLALAALVVTLMLSSGAIYHYLFLKAAREGWPVVSAVVRLVVRDEIAQRDRVMRDNLDVMAQRVGDMQARLVQLEAVGDRVLGLAGVKPEEVAPLRKGSGTATPGAGPGASPEAQRGPGGKAGAGDKGRPGGQGGLYLPVPLERPTLGSLQSAVEQLEEIANLNADLFLLAESRLFEARLMTLTVPSSAPVDGPVGSPFGFRSDPFTGRTSLHTGLDFTADPGTPVRAAAGGVVVSTDSHPQYGNLLEIDHGRGLTTLYAHNQRVLVKRGDIVKRGQQVATVGNTGRSSGPHLHFEVRVEGVPQDPRRFLFAAPGAAPTENRALASGRTGVARPRR